MTALIVAGCNASQSLPTPFPSNTPAATLTAASVRPLDTPAATPTITSTPSWRGITPGQTTRAEVIQTLGQPSIIQTYDDLESLNYYRQGLSSFPWGNGRHRLVLRRGIVQLIIADEDIGGASLSDTIQELGPYQTVVRYKGAYPSVYVFADRGVAAAAIDEWSGGLVTTEYFVPMTDDAYLASWGKYHLYDRPFPYRFPGHPMDVGIKPGQSSQQDVLRLYGQPDYVGPIDRWGHPPGSDPTKDRLEVFMYLVPEGVKWGNTFSACALVSFVLDNQDIVQLVHVWGSLRPGSALEDVFAKYGKPEWMYRRTDFLWVDTPEVPTTFFFPEKGVSAVTVGAPGIRPSDKLQAEWFYPPMSWDEYWSSWGAKPRSGFSGRTGQFEGELLKWTGFPAE